MTAAGRSLNEAPKAVTRGRSDEDVPRIFGIGNSHLDALRHAARPATSLDKFGFAIDYLSTFDPIYQPFWTLQDGRREPHNGFLVDAQRMIRELRPDIVVAFFSSNFQFANGTYGGDRPFDLVLPWSPGLGILPGREIIPYELVRETTQRNSQSWRSLLEQIVSFAAPAPVFAVSPPPPIADFTPYYAEIKEKAEACGVQPDSVRYKLWRAQIDTEQNCAEASGAGFLAAPLEAQNESGLRRLEYSHDILHGNIKYGELLVRQAQTCLEKVRESSGV